MKFNREQFPLRIIKTIMAFIITLLLAPIFHCDNFFAGVGSLKSMRESLTLSVHSLFEQLFSNFIAFSFAIVYSLMFGLNLFSISFALLSLFIVIKKTNFIDTYLTAGFTLIAMMLLSSNETQLLNSGFERFYSNFFGMIIALIVNAIFFKPRHVHDLNKLLTKINQYVHIIMTHDYDQYTYIELKNTLAELDREKSIVSDELKVKFISKNRKSELNERLQEIILINAQAEVVFELGNLDKNFRDIMIPIIIRLNYVKHYQSENSKILEIRQEIRSLYFDYTSDTNFFTNTEFLSKLNTYINLLQDNCLNYNN